MFSYIMTNILLKCSTQLCNLLKISTCHESRKVINPVVQKSHSLFTITLRHMSLTAVMAEDMNVQTLISSKFSDTLQYVQKYSLIHKQQIYDLIDDVASPNNINSYQVYMLLHWCNLLIDCTSLERVQLGEYLWSILTACNSHVYESHYNALLNLYVRNGYNFSPMKLLMDMKNKGIYPNDYTYKTCIEYCCQNGNVEEALTILEDLKKLRLPIAEPIFTSFVMGYAQMGDLAAVNETLNTMKANNLRLTNKTYAAVMCAYAKFNRIDKIRDIMRDCNSKNIYFNNTDILNVIYTLALNNHTKDISIMYKYLIKKTNISSSETAILLKLSSINQAFIAVSVLVRISPNVKFSNVTKLLLKDMINRDQMLPEITNFCRALPSGQTFKQALMTSLQYSLPKNKDLSLSLLKVYKNYCKIKPHFFWPFLVREANKYNLQGIVDILIIMANDFHVLPCIDTLVEYVLPFTFGDVNSVRNLLMECKIRGTTLNNAYVHFMLRKNRIREAAAYVHRFADKYFYKIIAPDLRNAALHRSDASNFVFISNNLVQNIVPCSMSDLNDEPLKITSVHMDRQLYDFMIDYPTHKILFKKIVQELKRQNISLRYGTLNLIQKFLDGHITDKELQLSKTLFN